ncbi:MAG: restriction endonuclease [Synechococcus sp. SB0669_bin_7]|nr:restriction endonuclease [Synechococcus sp. SB0675_bin_7]MYK85508.1 restriction endonuclease [Synechococcus sp. SB0669_bin_7]
MTTLGELRSDYHAKLGQQVIRFSAGADGADMTYPNFADCGSRSSILIANGIVGALRIPRQKSRSIPGQRAGALFEKLTCEFIEHTFTAISHMRPGKWKYLTSQTQISRFAQYRHLKILDDLVRDNRDLSTALGYDYLVTPDIIVARSTVSRDDVNGQAMVLDRPGLATLTPFLESNRSPDLPFLHASVSCKWTIRSDRSQNTRTEAFNLIRNRKGRLPHIVAVTAEPLPMRIASLALGTGDLDCVYHIALDELKTVCKALPSCEDQAEMLFTMIDGDRLRDISDLPFDLAI